MISLVTWWVPVEVVVPICTLIFDVGLSDGKEKATVAFCGSYPVTVMLTNGKLGKV